MASHIYQKLVPNPAWEWELREPRKKQIFQISNHSKCFKNYLFILNAKLHSSTSFTSSSSTIPIVGINILTFPPFFYPSWYANLIIGTLWSTLRAVHLFELLAFGSFLGLVMCNPIWLSSLWPISRRLNICDPCTFGIRITDRCSRSPPFSASFTGEKREKTSSHAEWRRTGGFEEWLRKKL